MSCTLRWDVLGSGRPAVYFEVADVKVAPNVAQGSICLSGDIVDVRIPPHSIADANSKILDYQDVIQRMAVQGVWEDNWRFLASNADNFALMGMELHHPSVFPLFEPTQVVL